ncbi:uncharacterized protein MONOS_17772 [Monocercomonoides exilis]|uniref:uncharacterized protein n=1 Tax=Monocercomonoides exilis TaxID=2049356 RepID=UPI003559A902|nr:hypothetical protein MONOS_17772 [Monocercomonoides exilis]
MLRKGEFVKAFCDGNEYVDKKEKKNRQEVEMNENELKRDISLCRLTIELGERIHMESAQGEGIERELEMIFSDAKTGHFSMMRMESGQKT